MLNAAKVNIQVSCHRQTDTQTYTRTGQKL